MPVKNLLKTLCDRFDRVESSGANYIRYANGIQICWGNAAIPIGTVTTTVNLPSPIRPKNLLYL